MRLLPSRGFRRGLLHGVAASVEHLQLMRGIVPATLIDVGANRGQFSLLVRTLHPGARIYAFEPLSRPAAKFERLFHGDAQTTLHRCAIGPQTIDRMTMYVSKEDDASSLLPHAATVTTESVAVNRLDEILEASDIVRPALLKLDVQGYEILALKGCGRLLDVMDFVYAEVSFVTNYQGQALADEVLRFLFDNGFSLAAMDDPEFDSAGRCTQAGFLFSRRPEHVHG